MDSTNNNPGTQGDGECSAGMGHGAGQDEGMGDSSGHSESLLAIQSFIQSCGLELEQDERTINSESDQNAQLMQVTPCRPVSLPKHIPDFEVDEFKLGRFLFHHVLPNSAIVRLRLFSYCCNAYGRGNTRDGFIAATHGDHIHVIHGCSATKSYCRCHPCWGAKPRYGSKLEPGFLSRTDIINIWNYVAEGPDRQLFFWANGSGSGPTYCGHFILKSDRRRDSPQDNGVPNECRTLGGSIPDNNDEEGSRKVSSEHADFTAKCDDIWKIGQMEWIAEADAILSLSAVIEKHERFIEGCRDIIIKRLVSKRKINFSKIKTWSFTDFKAAMMNMNCSFGFPRHKLQSRANTLNTLVHWFETQFEDEWPMYFMEFIRIFDGVNGKLNTLVLVGPASCGKTWLVNMFKAIALNTGVIRNWASGDRFCFDNAVDRRLLIHDECQFPIVAPDYLESYKQLAAGQSPTVNVKHKDAITLPGAPLFITANDHPLCKCPDQKKFFDNVRWRLYTVAPVPNFAELTEGVNGNPLALFDLHDVAMQLLNDK